MVRVYVGVGSNLGDRRAYIERSIEMLKSYADIRVDKVSPLYETDPVGGPPQGRFLNGVIKIETDLSCRELLHRLMDIENMLDRKRGAENGPRTIDLDILTYGDLHMEEPDLVVPHPRMKEREFVMRPLSDISDFNDEDI